MKSVAVAVGIALILAIALGVAREKPIGTEELVTVDANDIAALVEANNSFALDLYSLAASRKGNLFFSPYSISSALAMTYAGARGNTAAQMEEVLHFGSAPELVHPAFSQLNAAFNARGKAYRLSVANALWAQNGFEFQRDFLATAKTYYGAGARIVDFAGNTESARLAINKWVEDNTEGKIIDLIAKGVLDPLTRLVLTNAIYFKGRWENEFRPEFTANAPFYLGTAGAVGSTVDVPFMRQVERFRYAHTQNAQVLEMPYAGGDLAMLIVLPDEESSITDVEASVKDGGLEPFIDSLAYRRVDVSIPRFKFVDEMSLKEYLMRLGMVDAFDDKLADFSAMSDRRLYITQVLHKAFVEVNEEGTEAAAATAVVVGVKSAPVDMPVVFTADRPFLFAIRDVATGSILFMGRMADPR
ncbi:MAG: Serpin (serine protease inhibitor) [Firmicutes bacterium ADurb.Bin506]|jgi:serpin B|nr:MAG: Serpin (serine protease inhibitor) [Firmicutes bacterium ADurb.Bin506]